MSMKKAILIVAGMVVLVLGAEVAGYVVALNSDAYASAKLFVLTDSDISRQIGQVSLASLAPLDAEIRFTSDTGSANFVVTAKTASASHRVEVRLQKTSTGWQVQNSRIID